MKIFKYIFIVITGVMLFAACEKFLDKAPEAQVTAKAVFGTYESFQGFVDYNYGELRNYIGTYSTTTMNCGGETINNFISWSPAYVSWTGDYWYLAGSTDYAYNDYTSLFANGRYGYGINNAAGGGGSGIWTGGWRGIRNCNLALQNFKLLSEATDEERTLLRGQIYFFRAWFHHQIIDAYGGMPYIDTVFAPGDEMKEPRLTYQQTAEEIIKDYDRALPLLPENWDETVVGSQRLGANTGRVTKGVVLAYKAKLLLYAGSPLMNKFSGGDYTYNVEYCKRAADAGWEMIQLANKVVGGKKRYDLVPFANYSDNFYRTDGIYPWTSETIWERMDRTIGSSAYEYIKRQNSFSRMGGRYGEQVNQTFVDKFEMADGSRYIPALYDNDNTKRWDFRDPRFRKAIIVDRDQHGNDSRSVINLYEGSGTDKGTTQQITLPYLLKKFWPKGANGYDNAGITQLYRINPLMRLAEVYLDYAEAVTVAYGPTGSAPGSTLTAVEAVNIVRRRAGMPDVTAAATGYSSFLELVQNERNVELCFEGHYFFDIRRWYLAHLPENLICVDLKFDKAWTSFTRATIKTKVFEDPKHYWMPLNKNQTLLYPGFYQNPGWQ
jgi:starch-binding outer membrane protein, SusD/RagB family